MKLLRLRWLATIILGCLTALSSAQAAPLAKTLFGAKTLPAATAPAVYGFYSKGCFAGGVALPVDGPTWQVMRTSRNRRWGEPQMIRLIEQLSRKAARDGWPGLLIGDIAQPRGGPMVTGHASHQLGLDADIWFTPMPNRRLSLRERETKSAMSLLKPGTRELDERKWNRSYEAVLRDAAEFPEVERIFVHPAVKKKLCDTVKGSRSWMSKIRPFWGHDDHFHVRIGCPAGSPQCRPQHAPPNGDGCDKTLAWWLGDAPWRPAKGPAKPKARDIMTMSALPNACRAVLSAPSPVSAAAATLRPGSAPVVYSGEIDPGAVLSAMPTSSIPLPQPRPATR